MLARPLVPLIPGVLILISTLLVLKPALGTADSLILLPSLTQAQLSSEKALNRLIEERGSTGISAAADAFGTPPQARAHIEIIRRGTDFSSLRELTVASLAGSPPDLAAIEASELPALEAAHVALPSHQSSVRERLRALVRGMDHETLKSGENARGELIAIPFERVLPVLLIDQEMMFRIHVNPDLPLHRWEEIEALGARFNQHFHKMRSEQVPLAIPLQGSRGLWFFEALTSKSLWKREAGGLRSNRELIPAMNRLRAWSTGPDRLARTDFSWDRALQEFIDRKVPLIVSSTDALPVLREQAGFRWTAIPLPTLDNHPSELATGTNLVVLRDSPALWSILEDLFRPVQAARWLQSGGCIPLKPAWSQALKTTPPSGVGPALGLAGLPGPLRVRGTRTQDPEMVRARSSWIQGLVVLFGESSLRKPPNEILTGLDRQINSGIQE